MISPALRPEERLLVHACRLDLPPAAEQQVDALLRGPLDWDWLQREASQFRAEPLLHRQFSRSAWLGLVPAEVMASFEQAYQRTSMKNLQVYGSLRRILVALHEAGIPVILLKGSFLAQWIYGDIGLRPMGDIDLLCRKQDEDAIERILDGLGVEAPKDTPERELLRAMEHIGHGPTRFIGKIARLEVHYFLLSRHCPDPDRLQQDIWSKALLHDWEGLPVRSLDWEYMVLHLATHLYGHAEKSGIFLYWFSDLWEVLRRHSDTLDWDRLGGLARELGLERQCREVFDLLEEPWKGGGGPAVHHRRGLSVEGVLALTQALRTSGQSALPHYRDALLAVRHAGGPLDQLLYLVRLVVPPWGRMAQRHPEVAPAVLILYYLLDPPVRIGRLLKGLGGHVLQRRRN